MFREPSQQDQALPDSSRWSRQYRSRLAAALAATLLAALAAVHYGPRLSAATSVDARRLSIATAERRDLERDIASDAVVVARLSQTMTAAWAGSVALHVRAGDPVKVGQLLASINSPDLASRLLEERAQLGALEADAQRTEIEARKQRVFNAEDREIATLDEEAAERELRRKKLAYEAGAYPELEVLRAADALAKARLAMKRAQSKLDLDETRLALELKSRRLARDRQNLLVQDLARQARLLEVRSPVSGQVAQVLVADRASVTRDLPLLSVVDLTALELELKVPQTAASEIPIGAIAQVTSGGQTYQAHVTAISPEVVQGEVSTRLQFTGQTVPGLRQGQRLLTRVLLERHPDVLTVRRGPFLEESGGRYVYVVEGSRATRREIRIGAVSMSLVEITAGLQPGERVIIAGGGELTAPNVTLIN
jgi:HlyD family secretion protein